jgi:hypothetical protein
MGRWRPRPLLALALLFRIGTWVADLDRTLVGEPAVVVPVVAVRAGSSFQAGRITFIAPTKDLSVWL